MADSVQEIRAMRRQLRELTEKAKKNEQLLRRSQQRELDILNAQNLTELFEQLTTRLSQSFGLDRVTLVLCDPDHEIRHLLIASGGEVPAEVRFFDTLTGLAPQYASLRRPWLGAFQAADHQLILGEGTFGSVALIGLRRQGMLIGSINFASVDPQRYVRGLASDFLAHLGVIASFALENTVNRARLLRSGFTDVLTGWHNRRYLQVRLAEELARARRHRAPLSCLFLDLDHFKQINDTHGHDTGDVVLAECAQRIDAEVRGSDVAARYGGEEFVLLLPGTRPDDAARLAERIRQAVASEPIMTPAGVPVDVTVSIGVSSLETIEGEDKTLGERLLKQADLAMYSAKSAGRNCVATAA